MDYRMLGCTGLTVSALSFGASPLGGVFGPVDETEGIEAVHYAVDQGVNLFDVSPYYGITKAETVLGKALKGRRDQVVLATKAGRFGDTQFDFSKASIKRSVEASLARLQTDYVDILQAHDIEFGPSSQVLEETYEALRELKQEGKCRFIGMTAYPLSVLRRALGECELDVTISYAHFSLYNTLLLTGLLPLADARGVGVINASATGMGLFMAKPLASWHPAPPELVRVCREAVTYCTQQGVSAVDLALQYVYKETRVPTTLVGMSKKRHVEQNLKAVETRPDPAILETVLAILKPVHNTVWPSGTHSDEYDQG